MGKGVNNPSTHFLNIYYDPSTVLGPGHIAVDRALRVPALMKFVSQWEKIGSKHRLLNKCCGERVSRVSD